jgi:hypothetical protein
MKLATWLLTLLIASGVQMFPAWSEQSGEVFNGIVEGMDAAQAKLTVKNELGRRVVLDLANPDLLRGLAPGDQVSIELEKPGTIKKVTKLAVPELKAPIETEPPK